MQLTPIKKFEKLSSGIPSSDKMKITKITDYQNGSIIYEVTEGEEKHLYKNLKDVHNHIENLRI
ncbi:MAG: hypothetical protein KAT17_09740 [Candidatus Aminicenantes bacterium]|nr:hypothetical protein [Candidatus Aminicenantes bacterium]